MRLQEACHGSWRLAAEGVRGGHRLTSAHLSQLQELLAESSAFLKTCIKIRDKHGVHVDPDPILRWLDTSDRGETIVLHSVEGATLETWLFEASAQVLHDANHPPISRQADKPCNGSCRCAVPSGLATEDV